MEKFKNMKHDKPPKDKEGKDGKDGKHCGFMAVGITGCLGGYVTRVSLAQVDFSCQKLLQLFFYLNLELSC